MKTLAFLVLGSLMGVGLMALVQASTKAQVEADMQAVQVRHCEMVSEQIIREFDALIDAKKFPTQDQQDYWRQMSAGCQE